MKKLVTTFVLAVFALANSVNAQSIPQANVWSYTNDGRTKPAAVALSPFGDTQRGSALLQVANGALVTSDVYIAPGVYDTGTTLLPTTPLGYVGMGPGISIWKVNLTKSTVVSAGLDVKCNCMTIQCNDGTIERWTNVTPGTTGKLILEANTQGDAQAIIGAGAGGVSTQAQFNNGGVLGGMGPSVNGGFTWNSSTNLLTGAWDGGNNATHDLLALVNPSAATAGNQHLSPWLRFSGNGWKTAGTPGSESTDWAVLNVPTQGINDPGTKLVFRSQVNSGGYVDRFWIDNLGLLNTPSGSLNLLGSAAVDQDLTTTAVNVRHGNLILNSQGGNLTLYDAGAANGTTLVNIATTTAPRSLALDAGDANHTVTLRGNLTLGGTLTTANNFTTSGNFPLTLTQQGSTSVTMPASGNMLSDTGSTTKVPQFARLGLGAAADGTAPLLVNVPGIVNTSTDGFIFENTTAANGSTIDQRSPRIRLSGSAWNGSTADTFDFIQENITAGGSPATGTLTWSAQKNGGGYSNVLSITNSGLVFAPGNFTSNGTVSGAALSVSGVSVFNGEINSLNSLLVNAVITPAQITSNQDNYNPAGLSAANTIELTSDASRNITGLTATLAGQVLMLHNTGTQPLVLKNQSSSSTAGNRFALGGDITIAGDQSLMIHYDASRWRALGGVGGGGAGGTPGGSSGQVQWNNSGSLDGIAGSTWNGTSLLLAQSLAANTSGDELTISNSGTATAANQRLSPRLHFSGSGWKTNATAAAQTTDWVIENIPVQGAASPANHLVFSNQTNGGGYAVGLTLDETGSGTFVGNVTTTGLTVSSNNGVSVSYGGATANTSTVGAQLVNSTVASSGNQQFSPYTIWQGNGWKTNATAGSQAVAFLAEVRPIQGTANPSGQWLLENSINGGGLTDVFGVDSSGAIILSQITADPASPANGWMWYNSTSNALKAKINGSIVSLNGGGSGTPGGADTQLQYNNAGAFAGASTLTYSGSTLSDSISLAANTSGDGLGMVNTTNATSGNQRYSPAILWVAQGFKTDSIAGSRPVNFRAELKPVQGTALPSGNWTLSSQVNGGGYTERFVVSSAGLLTVNGNAFQVNGSSAIDQDVQTTANPIWNSAILNSQGGNLGLFDATQSHATTIVNTASLTAGRTLSINAGDANRTLTMTGNATLNQDVSTAGSPTWVAGTTTTGGFANVQAAGTNTTTAGLILTNTSAASASNQGLAPAIFLNGNGWKTNATAASQATQMKLELRPIQGTANPTTELWFATNINGAGSVDILRIGSDGALKFAGISGDPATVADGMVWYDSSGGHLRARIAGSSVSLGAGGGGGTPGGSDTQIQYNSSGSFAANSGMTYDGTRPSLVQSVAANTSADGLIITNNTAAAAANQRWSPRIRWTGQGWKTNSTAASQEVDWIAEARPVQGAANPTSTLSFAQQINAGGYTDVLSLNSNGTLSVAGNSLTVSGTSTINQNVSTAGAPQFASVSYLDAGLSHYMLLQEGSTLTANRTLTVNTGDANRNVTLTGDSTLNQDVSTAGSPTFVQVTTNLNTGTTIAQSPLLASYSTSTFNGTITGLGLVNGSTASNGNQGFSPAIIQEGQGWNTSASQKVDFKQEVRPVQAATHPTGTLAWSSSISGAGYVDQALLKSDGSLTVTGAISASNLSLGGTLTTAAALTQAGAFATTITSTAISNSTLPAGTHTLAGLDVAEAWTANQTFGNTNLWVNDTDASNKLNLKWNENDSSDRTLNVLVNSANRSINLSGNLTTAGDFITSGAFATTVTSTATTNSTLPAGTHTLAGLDVAQAWTANQTFGSTNLWINDTDASNKLNIKWNENDSADRTLDIVMNGGTRSIAFGGNISTASDFSTAGTGSGLTLTTAGTTNVTLPTSGTLNAKYTAMKWSLLNGSIEPDTSGNVFLQQLSAVATNNRWKHLFWTMKNAGSARISLFGEAPVPTDYNGSASVVFVWTSATTSGNVVWKFDYRSIAGTNTNSLDQTTQAESVNNAAAAPGAAWRRMTTTIALTSANITADDTIEFEASRDKSSGSDTLAGDCYLIDVYLQYTQ